MEVTDPSYNDHVCNRFTTIEEIEVEFAIMTNKFKQALIDNNIDVVSLIETQFLLLRTRMFLCLIMTCS